MIDVHGKMCNTPCNYGLKYPCLLNNIWRTFLNSKSSSIQPQSPTIPSYYIKPNKNSKEIYLTYGPALGWTLLDNGADAPYNFAVPAKIEEDAVMFIGMNPSYIPSNSNDDYSDYWSNKPIIVNKSHEDIDATTGWQFEEFDDPDSIFCKSTYFEDLRKLTAAFYTVAKNKGRTNYTTKSAASSKCIDEEKYYRDINRERIPNYAHLDLLAIRHTKQKDIEDALTNYYNNTYPDFVNFINAQIDIFKELLQAAKPKVIIVNSGLASNILRNNGVFFQDNTLSRTNNTDIWKDLRTHLNMQLSWDDNISAYRWVNPTFKVDNEKGIPVFLCGMTSGQRALDSGRREELIAQVAKVI